MKFSVAVHNTFAACCVVVLHFAAQLWAGEWPEWRGPQRSGHTDKADLPLTWDGKKQENVLWKVPADFGHSSPIIWGERLFLTASVRKLKKGSDQTADNQQHRAVCYRTEDGKKLWQTDIAPGNHHGSREQRLAT